MYNIYLYSDIDFRRGGNNYGYWTGKSYIVQGQEYPIVETKTNQCKRKEYKSLKRAISGGEIAYEKYAYVCGFDIEDENENVVYQSYKCYKNASKPEISKNKVKEKAKVSTPTLDRMLDVQEQSQLCGEFLEWLLSKYTIYDKKMKRESPFMDVMRDCGDYINKEKLLAEFFEIDLDEAEKERQLLLNNSR